MLMAGYYSPFILLCTTQLNILLKKITAIYHSWSAERQTDRQTARQTCEKSGSDEETIQHIMPGCKTLVYKKKRLISIIQDE